MLRATGAQCVVVGRCLDAGLNLLQLGDTVCDALEVTGFRFLEMTTPSLLRLSSRPFRNCNGPR